MAAPSGYSSRPAPGNDIFTILIISAFVIVAATLGYAIFKCTELLGIPFPIFAS